MSASRLSRSLLSHRLLPRLPSSAVNDRHRVGLTQLVRGNYSNQNKPETKSSVAQSVKEAKEGKSSAHVAEHREATQGQAMARETAKPKTSADTATGTGTTSAKAPPINRSDAKGDVLREAEAKENSSGAAKKTQK